MANNDPPGAPPEQPKAWSWIGASKEEQRNRVYARHQPVKAVINVRGAHLVPRDVAADSSSSNAVYKGLNRLEQLLTKSLDDVAATPGANGAPLPPSRASSMESEDSNEASCQSHQQKQHAPTNTSQSLHSTVAETPSYSFDFACPAPTYAHQDISSAAFQAQAPYDMSTDHGHYGGHRGMHQIGARDDTPSDLDMMDASNVEDSGPQSRHTVYAFQSLQEYAASDASMLDAPDSSAPLPFSFSSPRKEQVDTSMHGLVPVEDDQFEQFGLSSGPSLKFHSDLRRSTRQAHKPNSRQNKSAARKALEIGSGMLLQSPIQPGGNRKVFYNAASQVDAHMTGTQDESAFANKTFDFVVPNHALSPRPEQVAGDRLSPVDTDMTLWEGDMPFRQCPPEAVDQEISTPSTPRLPEADLAEEHETTVEHDETLLEETERQKQIEKIANWQTAKELQMREMFPPHRDCFNTAARQQAHPTRHAESEVQDDRLIRNSPRHSGRRHRPRPVVVRRAHSRQDHSTSQITTTPSIAREDGRATKRQRLATFDSPHQENDIPAKFLFISHVEQGLSALSTGIRDIYANPVSALKAMSSKLRIGMIYAPAAVVFAVAIAPAVAAAYVLEAIECIHDGAARKRKRDD